MILLVLPTSFCGILKIAAIAARNSIPKEKKKTHPLSGPVSRDTARLSQRYPPSLRAMGFLVSQHGQLGAIPPPPFLSVSPLESMRSAIHTPQKRYLSDTWAIPYENKENACDTPLCDTISKGYCAIWGGISPWAAKHTHMFWAHSTPTRPKKRSKSGLYQNLGEKAPSTPVCPEGILAENVSACRRFP